MNATVVIATYGSDDWCDLAWSRAYPSAERCRIGDPNVWTTEIILRHLPDGTLAQARNAAAADATGDWLCFLDADDELEAGYLDAMAKAERRKVEHDPETLERTQDALLIPAVSFAEPIASHPMHHSHQAVDGHSFTKPVIPNGGGSRPLIDINCAVIGTLVPRRLFLDAGGFRDLPALEDWDLWLRCEEAGAKLVPVPDAVYRAHVRDGSRNTDQTLYHALRDEALARRRPNEGSRDVLTGQRGNNERGEPDERKAGG